MLICAGGFAFHGEQAWFNQRVFWVDTEAVCRHLSAVRKDERFFSALPGQTFWMEGNRLAKVEESTPFLGVAPRAQWPARGRILRADTPDYAPATGRRDLADGDAERASRAVGPTRGCAGRRHPFPQPAFDAGGRSAGPQAHVRSGAAPWSRTVPRRSSNTTPPPAPSFPAWTVDPRDVYIAGWECWATDLARGA